MKKYCIFTLACIFGLFLSVNAQTDCLYWFDKVDPKAEPVSYELDEKHPRNVVRGVEGLLTLQGRKQGGLRQGSKQDVSQPVPIASVEINALYQISELFYGNEDFAQAIT